jgi:hypothetical protein
MPTYTPIIFNNRDLTLHKAIVLPRLGERTVLTNEPWNYVDLALARQKQRTALFYWQQAHEFFKASHGLPVQSAPLLLYYSFLNATKALLEAKGIVFNPLHGVKEWNPTPTTRGFNSGVTIKVNGVLPSLSSYYAETEARTQHSLKDIFFNLPFIHRTYGLTYTSQAEMFIPVVKPRFVVEDGTRNVFVSADVSVHFSTKRYMNRMPPTFIPDPGFPLDRIISRNSVALTNPKKLAAADLRTLGQFARSLREDLYYINGAQTLWYVKATVSGNTRIRRQTTTLTLAAMHRLSEVSRYAPMKLVKYLEGQKNWLLSEFITMSGQQFIDEIASEITGMQIMIPNVRPAA